ncbi:MAG: uroporphyrinogen-III synthase [Campylobacterota bacterium]|nr:uroporphyrinogen-III synthase [Campylobacterota bacterium]
MDREVFVVNSLPLYLVPEKLRRSLEIAKRIFIQDGLSPNMLLFCREEAEVAFFKDASEAEKKEGLILMNSKTNKEENTLDKKHVFLSMSKYDLINVTAELEHDGSCVYPFPSISFKPLVKEVKIPDVDWIIFTSKVGVNYFFRFLNDDIGKLDGIKIACVGKKTEEVLNNFGVRAAVVPKTFNGEKLAEALAESDIRGRRVLLAQAEKTRGVLERELKKKGAEIKVLSLYRNSIPHLCYAFVDKYLRHLHANNEVACVKRAKNVSCIDYAMFTSPSAVQHTIELLGDMWKDWSKNVGLFVAIGPVTAKVLKDWGKVVYPQDFTIQNMLEFIYRRKNGRLGKDS